MRWDEPETLRAALDYIWRVLDGGNLDRGEVNRLVAECDSVIPDAEDFETSSVSAALDTGTALVETLRSLLDGDTKRVVDVASFCRDTVDMYIQNRDRLDYNTDPLFKTKIAQDPRVTRELARQAAVLSELANHPVLDSTLLKRLRDDAPRGCGRRDVPEAYLVIR